MTRVFSMRWLVAVGRWSYGIYLWHLPVIQLLDPVVPRSGPGGWLLLTVTTLAIAVPLGAATFAWVEQPAIRWSKSTREERAARRREREDDAAESASASRAGRPLLSRGRRGSRARPAAASRRAPQPQQHLDADVAQPPGHLGEHAAPVGRASGSR